MVRGTSAFLSEYHLCNDMIAYSYWATRNENVSQLSPMSHRTKAPGKDTLLQPGNRTEDPEGTESHAIAVPVIRAGLAQAEPPEAPGPRDRKCFHGPLALEAVVGCRISFSYKLSGKCIDKRNKTLPGYYG
jgi:hypothetical protein